jgi:hypothetical protein
VPGLRRSPIVPVSWIPAPDVPSTAAEIHNPDKRR